MLWLMIQKPEHLEYVNTMNSQQIKEKCSYNENDLNCDNFMALTGKCIARELSVEIQMSHYIILIKD